VAQDSPELEGLLPCPFCGGGQTWIDKNYLSPTMKGQGSLISATIRHQCAKTPGVVGASIQFRGREIEDAVRAWNERK
jgi:hypothetical protein